MGSISYKSAGVDLDAYAEAMSRLPQFVRRTHTPRVLDLPGGFAGLFRLQSETKPYRDPVLVSGADGVGTKIKVAIQAGCFKTIGIDLVAMCVNDCICLGAEPLFFLDYLALPRDNPDLIADLVEGVSEGCLQAQAALIGGETAIMPDLYAADDFDMAGFCVGVVERDRIIDGSRIRPGDCLLGIPSSGLHSNGYSLVRKIVFDKAGLAVDSEIAELKMSVREALLTPTTIYVSVVQAVLQSVPEGALTGIAHITGGGLEENVSRLLPAECRLSIDRTAWSVPPIFSWLQRLGEVESDEMYRVFNMGIGMVFVVRAESAARLQSDLELHGYHAHLLGQVESTRG